MTIKWWEKTVEYLFVKKYVEEGQLVMPLDGDEEAQGDTVIAGCDRWILIEFKKEKSSIPSEKKKFIDFKSAKDLLKGSDKHHHIVYGSPIKVGEKVELHLKAQTYFSMNESPDIETMLTTGIGFDEFHDYVKEFVSFKKRKEESSGEVVLDTNSNVIGVSAGGVITKCMTMKEYVVEYIPELAPKREVGYSNAPKPK